MVTDFKTVFFRLCKITWQLNLEGIQQTIIARHVNMA